MGVNARSSSSAIAISMTMAQLPIPLRSYFFQTMVYSISPVASSSCSDDTTNPSLI